MSRPLVLVDVDGVLNAVSLLGRSEAWDDWRVGTAEADGRTFRITWSPTVVAAVLGWRDVADVQWLTTWGHAANTSLRHLLELPELPVAGTHDAPVPPVGDGETHADVAPAAPDPFTGRWWKFDVVRALVRADPERPVVWLDDDLAGQEDIRAWMRREASCLLIAPQPASGLTTAHLDAVEAFLQRA